MTTLTKAVSGQSQNCSGNLEISPGIGTLGIFFRETRDNSGTLQQKCRDIEGNYISCIPKTREDDPNFRYDLRRGAKGGSENRKTAQKYANKPQTALDFFRIPKLHVQGGPWYESWRDNNGVTGLRNSHLGVIAAKEVLLEKYIFKDLPLFHGTIGGSWIFR